MLRARSGEVRLVKTQPEAWNDARSERRPDRLWNGYSRLSGEPTTGWRDCDFDPGWNGRDPKCDSRNRNRNVYRDDAIRRRRPRDSDGESALRARRLAISGSADERRFVADRQRVAGRDGCLRRIETESDGDARRVACRSDPAQGRDRRRIQ